MKIDYIVNLGKMKIEDFENFDLDAYMEWLRFYSKLREELYEYREVETNLQTRIDKAAETIRILLGEKNHTDEFGIETTMLLDDIHFYLKYGKVCSSLGSYWEEHNI